MDPGIPDVPASPREVDGAGPSWDRPIALPPWSSVQERIAASGKRVYSISFTLRSGSTLLCDDLISAGLGHPAEHFQFPVFPVLVGTLAEHLALMAETWDTDFLGLKINWYQMTQVITRLQTEGYAASVGFDLRDVFPEIQFLHILRKDKISQAVSAWRAQESGTWHIPAGAGDDPGRPPYDFTAIRDLLQRIALDEWLWRDHFERMGVAPLTIVYEDYVADRTGHLERIADYLGAPRPTAPVGDRLQVMRDDWSNGIIERFRSDIQRPH